MRRVAISSTHLDHLMNRSKLIPDEPYHVVHEDEPDGHGGTAKTTTVFLTVSTCPIGCNMCDLHRNTLPYPTETGAVPRQIQHAVAGVHPDWIKLYNSGNFFDPRSIPPSDYQAIAELCQPYDRVIVENHPRFGQHRLREFLDYLPSQLEIAVGLETVQPRWLQRLGKQMSRDDFDGYAKSILTLGVDLRVFLILGVPGGSVKESIRWARLSVRHAIACGARHISIIPARAGHGWGGQSDRLPTFSLEALSELQDQLLTDADQRAVITLDLWDLESDAPLKSKLEYANLDQNHHRS